MRTVLRGLAVWVVIIVVETLHGLARTMFLAPVIGDFRARQAAVFTGSLLIVLVTTLFIGWLRPANIREAAWVGIVWLVLTLTFEITFGRLVVHASWARIASDYDLPRGGLLPLGLLVLAGAPLIAAKLRRVLEKQFAVRCSCQSLVLRAWVLVRPGSFVHGPQRTKDHGLRTDLRTNAREPRTMATRNQKPQ